MAPTPSNIPAPSQGNRRSPVASIVCLLMTAGILFAGLWPFELNPDNKVAWSPNEDGIRFYGQGMLVSRAPLVIQGSLSGNPAFTIEFLIRPDKEIFGMVASILTLYDGNQEQVIFGQWKKALIIRIPAAKTGRHSRYREIGVENVLGKDMPRLITVMSNRETTAVYIDGKLAKRSRRFSLMPKDRPLSGQLILGNSPEGTNPWNGTFSGVAIYEVMLTSQEIRDHFHAWQKRGRGPVPIEHAGRQPDKPASQQSVTPLSLYLFNEDTSDIIHDQARARNDLPIPATFKPLRRTILGMPDRDQWFSRANMKDVAINIIGFTPWGFFFPVWMRSVKKLPAPFVYGITLLAGTCLSLAVELIQSCLPARDSSFMDFLSNFLGTVLGICILQYARPVFQKVKGRPRPVV